MGILKLGELRGLFWVMKTFLGLEIGSLTLPKKLHHLSSPIFRSIGLGSVHLEQRGSGMLPAQWTLL